NLTGVFKTTDGGAKWRPSNSGLPSRLQVRALAVDPQTSGTVYAGINSTEEGGLVFKSIDGGDTWVRSSTGLPGSVFEFVESLVIDPQTPSTLYVSVALLGQPGLVLKSTDSGGTWIPANGGLPSGGGGSFGSILAIDPQAPATLYFYSGTPHGLFKTENGGLSWSAINNGLPNFNQITSVAVDPRTPATLYVGLISGSNDSGVFKTVDGGATWAISNTGRLSEDAIVAVDPLTPSTIYAGGRFSGVFKST